MDINPERARDMGRRLRVKWDGDEKWYEGYVLRFNPSSGKHTVYYPVEGSNGTQETLSLDDVEFEWIEEQIKPLAGPTQQPVTPPGSHPGLLPAAQVIGAALQQADLSPVLPMNPATGRVVGDLAAEITIARNEAIDAKNAASGSVSHSEGLHSTAPAPTPVPSTLHNNVPNVPTPNVPAPNQANASLEKMDASGRVALPLPLPQRPIADDTEAAKDGLELLSAVAASLPERPTLPPPSDKGESETSVLVLLTILSSHASS
jgi:hypothetical protein